MGGDKERVEKEFKGVHEFKPHVRGDCFTKKFTSIHPYSIQNNMDKLKEKFKNQLMKYI